MKMKKTLTAVVALALVAAVSVAGTMAYLTAKTDVVNNTFTAGSLGTDKNLKLELLETPVKQDTNGVYVIGDDSSATTKENQYLNVMPGTTNYKDPYVNVSNLATDAYLFIEVVNKDPNITAVVDKDNWTVTELDPTTDGTAKGAKVYMYKTDAFVNSGATLTKVGVLAGNEFTVGNFTEEQAKDLTFEPITVKAYMCQAAGFADATAAWNACFANK